MFLRLGFTQTVTMKLVYDQGINSPWYLASLSDEDIATKNLNLGAFMLNMLEHWSRTYDMKYFNSTSTLKYQHQWELEQKKQDNIKAYKVDKNN